MIAIYQPIIGLFLADTFFSMVFIKGEKSGSRVIASMQKSFSSDQSWTESLHVVKQSMKAFMDENRIINPEIHIGIDDRRIMRRDITLPLAAKENLKSTLKWEMPKYIPLESDEVVFDFQTISVDRQKKEMHLKIYAFTKEQMNHLVAMTAAPLKGAASLVPGTFGLAALFTRYGGEPDSFVYVFSDALQIYFGFVVKGRLLASHTQPMMKPVGSSQQIDVSVLLDRFIAKHELPQETPILLSGAQVQEDRSLKNKITGYLSLPDTLSGESGGILMAYGIALNASDTRELPNLLPMSCRAKPGRLGIYIMAGLVICLTLILGAWAGGKLYTQYRLEKQLENSIAKNMAEAEQLHKKLENVRAIEDNIRQFNLMQKDKRLVSDILLEITRVIPDSAWVQKFSMSPDGAVVIEGYADLASALLQQLEQSPLFSGVHFISPITRYRSQERYRIGLNLR